jgi:hypothetical protein
MAKSGYNGNNASQIGYSTSLSVSINDESGNPIDISNTSQYIDVYVPRDLSLSPPTPTYVNTTFAYGYGSYIPVAFPVSATNASIHFELTPINQNNQVGYIILQKFGSLPINNQTYRNFDNWQLLCPNSNILAY